MLWTTIYSGPELLLYILFGRTNYQRALNNGVLLQVVKKPTKGTNITVTVPEYPRNHALITFTQNITGIRIFPNKQTLHSCNATLTYASSSLAALLRHGINVPGHSMDD